MRAGTTTGTGDEVLAMPAGPVSCTITSPWGAEHLGRINLNNLEAYLDQTLCG